MQGKVWKDYEVEFAVRLYGNTPTEVIGKLMGKSANAVHRKMAREGVRIVPRYTAEDELYIEESYGERSVQAIAGRLGRSYDSVSSKLKRMRVGEFHDCCDGYTISDISELLCKPNESVRYWALKGDLCSRKIGHFRVVKEKELFRFLRERPDWWDATKVTNKVVFLDEPWFEEKRKADFQKMITNRWGEWYPDAK